MPILNTSSPDCGVVSSSCCSTTFSASDDDEPQFSSSATAGSRGLGSRGQLTEQCTIITEIQEDEFEEEDRTIQKKKRGPKKKRMTPGRIVKLKQRRLKVSNLIESILSPVSTTRVDGPS